jgi:hypothetical protein
MLARLRLAFGRAALRLALPATGMRLIDDHEPDDIFVVGFPKSGHTWCQYLLTGLVFGIDAAAASDALVQDLIPDVEGRLAYKRYAPRVIFKSHRLPAPRCRRAIYLLRDGRDAMTSYFHHHNAVFSQIDFLTLVQQAPHLEARWHEHVERWLANPHQAELLVVRYEDLLTNTAGELARMAAFAGFNATDEQIARAVAGASFKTQQQREARLGWDHRWPKEQRFVRRGQAGSFRDEMPPEALAAFLAEAGPTLKKNGYPV